MYRLNSTMHLNCMGNIAEKNLPRFIFRDDTGLLTCLLRLNIIAFSKRRLFIGEGEPKTNIFSGCKQKNK